MTTMVASVDHGRPAMLRPVPWRRMAWVTWRQHQLLLAGAAITFGSVAIYLTVMGYQIHTAYAAVTACRPVASSACQQVVNNFFGAYQPGVGITEGVLQLLPALIGAFAGAPILAREIRSGHVSVRLDSRCRAHEMGDRETRTTRRHRDRRRHPH
jgi:hypothetical protein